MIPGAGESPPVGPDVVLFPQAGSGDSWASMINWGCAGSPHVMTLERPGRGRRWAEKEPSSLAGLVAESVETILAYVDSKRPWIAVGASLGGLLAYETVHALPPEGQPRLLVVTSCRAPQFWENSPMQPDETERILTAAIGGTKDTLDRDIIEAMRQPLLMDVALTRAYSVPQDRPALAVPLTSVRGTADTMVSRAQMTGWRAYTTKAYQYIEVSAGHDIVRCQTALLGKIIQEVLG